jgi:hypothetical protein
LTDLTLLCYEMLKYLPSQIAASSIIVALHLFDKPCWNSNMSLLFSYKYQELHNCVLDINTLNTYCATSETDFQVVREKHARRNNVTIKLCGYVKPHMTLLPQFRNYDDIDIIAYY